MMLFMLPLMGYSLVLVANCQLDSYALPAHGGRGGIAERGACLVPIPFINVESWHNGAKQPMGDGQCEAKGAV